MFLKSVLERAGTGGFGLDLVEVSVSAGGANRLAAFVGICFCTLEAKFFGTKLGVSTGGAIFCDGYSLESKLSDLLVFVRLDFMVDVALGSSMAALV